MIIPNNISDVLPPIRPGQQGHSPDRSPYRVTLMDIVDRFSHSPERRLILNGFLDYRAAIHQIGLNNGFQWLDGRRLKTVKTAHFVMLMSLLSFTCQRIWMPSSK